jgi:hypothetical protein
MPIGLTCACGKQLRAPDELAGRQGQCPACGGLLQIPERDATVTGAIPPSLEAEQAVTAILEWAGREAPGSPESVVTPPAGSAANLQDREGAGTADDDNAKPTVVGCVLTLLTVVVIFGVALPIVQWRDPATGRPLPRAVAIFSPFLIGAAFHGIGLLILRLIGLRVWSKREKDVER